MEGKKSFGLLLVSAWLAVTSGVFLIQAVFPVRHFTRELFFDYYPPQQLVWMISSAILVGFITGGIYILRREEFGRGLVVFLAIIDIPHLVVGKAIFNYRHLEPMYWRNTYFIALSIVIDIAVVYFLNHPRIKEQFR